MTKESPLIERHRLNGAQFGEEDGWIVPVHFGDPLREYEAARSHAGLFDLSHRSLLGFTGPDRASYLHGLVSNNVNALASGKGIHAAFLDINGKVLADGRIFCTNDSLLLDISASLKEKILAHLNHYLIADEVEIDDGGRQVMISLQGKEARRLLEEALEREIALPAELDHVAGQCGAAEIRIIRSDRCGEGYDLVIDVEGLAAVLSRLEEVGKKFHLRWAGAQAQEILRIESGAPRYGVDMDEGNILLETGLDRAVSFDKGCYLGQEVIERIYSRGHVNRKLVGMVLEGDRPAGRDDAIRADDTATGRVTSSVFSPALNRPIALGYVHREHGEPGTRLSIDVRGAAVPARVSSLPFVRSSA